MFDASIVLLSINQYNFISRCVKSLRKTAPNCELILIDNGWDRETKLVDVDQYHNFGINLGYSIPCNIGAEYARADNVVFMNNDIVAHDGWLEPMLEHLNNESNTAIVGSKLLYPDGTIQHAGAYFRGINGKLEGFHYLTERPGGKIAAVTAACMAVKKNEFLESGGFNEAYWVGNEDMDFCLRLREWGRDVVYEPRSVLTHYESQSGAYRWQKIHENVDLLTDRWLRYPEIWNI